MLSPADAIVEIAMNCAAWPLATASAAAPPSSAAMRFSKTSCCHSRRNQGKSRERCDEARDGEESARTSVGLPIRE